MPSLRPQLDDLLEIRHQARTLGLESHHLVNSALVGLYASAFKGSGLNFDETREYREGDDIRNMDWRVTARTGRPHLKVFREERERSVMFCVDQGPHMHFGTRGTFKSIQAARATALLGWSASMAHERVGALLFGDPTHEYRHFRSTRSRRALWRTLHALTEVTARGAADPAYLGHALQRLERGLHAGSVVFVIGAFDVEPGSIERVLGGLRQKHTLVLLPVDDPADFELPAMGKVVFSGPDGRLLEVDTSDEEGRRRYREDWERRRGDLRRLAGRLGIPLLPIRTDVDVHRALTAGLRERISRRRLN